MKGGDGLTVTDTETPPGGEGAPGRLSVPGSAAAVATGDAQAPPELTVILPAYNEQAVVARSIARVDAFLRGTGRSYEILLGDDGSKDATVAVARATECAALRIVTRPHSGKGAILTAALREARGEYAGFIDADLEIDIAYLTEFLRLLDSGCDAVIARKTEHADPAKRRPLRRRILTAAYNATARLLFRTSYRDHQAGMKFFRRSMLRRVLPTLRSTGWIWDTEMLVSLRRAHAVVQQVPIVTSEVPGRIPKVSWLTTSLAMARELVMLRLQLLVRRAPASEAETAAVSAGASSSAPR
jgi:glycosyltransferase involved in cell wall biosynthesis